MHGSRRSQALVAGLMSVLVLIALTGAAADGADHLAMAFDPIAARHMLNALDPAHAVAPVCTLVLPGVGNPSAVMT